MGSSGLSAIQNQKSTNVFREPANLFSNSFMHNFEKKKHTVNILHCEHRKILKV